VGLQHSTRVWPSSLRATQIQQSLFVEHEQQPSRREPRSSRWQWHQWEQQLLRQFVDSDPRGGPFVAERLDRGQ
jgi:hypothetical protein